MNKKVVFLICTLIILIIIVYSFSFYLNKNAKALVTRKEDNNIIDAPVKVPEPAPNEEAPKHNITTQDGATYVDGYLIVNKTYSLPESYGGGLTKETEKAYFQMQEAAKNEGINLYMLNGYRSYLDQKIIYNNYVQKDGQIIADTYSARPGHSEHQSGLAMDLNSLDQNFAGTPEGKWLNDNAYKYGFIIRYPEGKENITGYMFEPWHIRFVDTNLSYKLYNGGLWITMEEYFDLTSKYE